MTAADLSDDNLALLEAKLKADLETVQKVRALMREHLGAKVVGSAVAATTAGAVVAPVPSSAPPDTVPVPAPASMSVTTNAAKDVKTAVKNAVAELGAQFKFGAVKDKMRDQRTSSYKDTSVRAVLMRMVQTGDLRVVKAGIGRGGSTFGKA